MALTIKALQIELKGFGYYLYYLTSVIRNVNFSHFLSELRNPWHWLYFILISAIDKHLNYDLQIINGDIKLKKLSLILIRSEL